VTTKDSKSKKPFSTTNADGSITVHLKEILTLGDETLGELTLAKPKAKHLKGVNISNMRADELIQLASKLSAHPPAMIGELGMQDFVFVSGVIGDFLGGGGEDGKTL